MAAVASVFVWAHSVQTGSRGLKWANRWQLGALHLTFCDSKMPFTSKRRDSGRWPPWKRRKGLSLETKICCFFFFLICFSRRIHRGIKHNPCPLVKKKKSATKVEIVCMCGWSRGPGSRLALLLKHMTSTEALTSAKWGLRVFPTHLTRASLRSNRDNGGRDTLKEKNVLQTSVSMSSGRTSLCQAHK